MGVKKKRARRALATDDGERKSVDMEDTDGSLGNMGDESTGFQVEDRKSTIRSNDTTTANIFECQRQHWVERKDGLNGKKEAAEETRNCHNGCQEGMCIWLEVKGQAGNCKRRDSGL